MDDLTFNSITKRLAIDAKPLVESKTLWGGYRAGLTGKTTFAMKDYGVKMDLSPASANVALEFIVEGVKQ
ncbi:hypothetical protein [Shewanella saliphila]|uniref:Lipid/polyisoprenoid-binding YceI-like domain-containing protein n=1 Tax=Shewanella saliphila TaxID=2282698 RepID=A0ABQ2Q176_9GAMM|nr:hypothetical protein [Shewanella saliphila]MCL1100447.1 hypothetical protein [Shewanella saliphila]GGP40117.1 hypothetical protein GCM10009409_03720 [Shewanella saliphila]